MSTGDPDEPTPGERLVLIGCGFLMAAVLVVVATFAIALGLRAL